MIDLSLNFFNTSWGIYSVPKESNNTAMFLSKSNETQLVPLLFYHGDLLFILLHAPSFILGIIFPEKTPLNLGS